MAVLRNTHGANENIIPSFQETFECILLIISPFSTLYYHLVLVLVWLFMLCLLQNPVNAVFSVSFFWCSVVNRKTNHQNRIKKYNKWAFIPQHNLSFIQGMRNKSTNDSKINKQRSLCVVFFNFFFTI